MEKFHGPEKKISSELGQATIEAVLLIVVLLAFFAFATKQLREEKVIQNFTDKSTVSLKNMASYGTWKEGCKPLGATGSSGLKRANCHPNSINRAISSAPD